MVDVACTGPLDEPSFILLAEGPLLSVNLDCTERKSNDFILSRQVIMLSQNSSKGINENNYIADTVSSLY